MGARMPPSRGHACCVDYARIVVRVSAALFVAQSPITGHCAVIVDRGTTNDHLEAIRFSRSQAEHRAYCAGTTTQWYRKSARAGLRAGLDEQR